MVEIYKKAAGSIELVSVANKKSGNLNHVRKVNPKTKTKKQIKKVKGYIRPLTEGERKKNAEKRAKKIERKRQKLLANKVLSLGRLEFEAAAAHLIHYSARDLQVLKEAAEVINKSSGIKRRNLTRRVMNNIDHVIRQQASMTAHRDGASERKIENRKVTSALVNSHTHGKIIGGVKITEFRSGPSNVTYATRSKTRN
jgi:hypothetical protein